MSSRKYKKPLSLNLKPSNYLFYFIIVVHLLAVSVLTLSLEIYLIIKIIIFMVICISLYLSLKNSNAIAFGSYFNKIEYKTEMEWLIINSNEQSFKVILQKNWFVLSGLVILYFKDDSNNIITTIILPDVLKKSDLRLLKLHLSQIK